MKYTKTLWEQSVVLNKIFPVTQSIRNKIEMKGMCHSDHCMNLSCHLNTLFLVMSQVGVLSFPTNGKRKTSFEVC